MEIIGRIKLSSHIPCKRLKAEQRQMIRLSLCSKCWAHDPLLLFQLSFQTEGLCPTCSQQFPKFLLSFDHGEGESTKVTGQAVWLHFCSLVSS